MGETFLHVRAPCIVIEISARAIHLVPILDALVRLIPAHFWATVTSNGSLYATGPLSCLSCLCVTLVYCGQTVGWIKVPLGAEVGLGPGDIVLDRDPARPQKRAQQPPLFGPCLISIVAKRLDESG